MSAPLMSSPNPTPVAVSARPLSPVSGSCGVGDGLGVTCGGRVVVGTLGLGLG